LPEEQPNDGRFGSAAASQHRISSTAASELPVNQLRIKILKGRSRLQAVIEHPGSCAFRNEHGEYPAGSLIRNPHNSKHAPYTDDEGALIYVKVGHLA